MKSVQSEGGPFIILDSASASLWGGVMSKSFMTNVNEGTNDYEALCTVLSRPEHVRKGLLAVQGRSGWALVLGMPYELQVLFNDPAHACIIQVHYAESEWSIANLDRSGTSLKSQYEPCYAQIEMDECELFIFDSSFYYGDIGDNFLKIRLESGTLFSKSSLCQPDPSTLIDVVELWTE